MILIILAECHLRRESQGSTWEMFPRWKDGDGMLTEEHFHRVLWLNFHRQQQAWCVEKRMEVNTVRGEGKRDQVGGEALSLGTTTYSHVIWESSSSLIWRGAIDWVVIVCQAWFILHLQSLSLFFRVAIFNPHFANREMWAWWDKVICPRVHGWELEESGMKCRVSLILKSLFFPLNLIVWPQFPHL